MNEDYLSDFLVYLELDLNYSDNTVKTYENSIEKLILFNVGRPDPWSPLYHNILGGQGSDRPTSIVFKN